MRCATKRLVHLASVLSLVVIASSAFALPAVSNLTVDPNLSSLTLSGNLKDTPNLGGTLIPMTAQSAGSLTAIQNGTVKTVIDPTTGAFQIASAQLLSNEDHMAEPGWMTDPDPNLSYPEHHIAIDSPSAMPAAPECNA